MNQKSNTTSLFKFYRDVCLWPLSDEFNYDEWLSNFQTNDERDIAIKLLDYFVFIPDRHINQMLATVIGKCGYFFQHQRGEWSIEQFKTDCWYSFIPGEEQSPTDSGYLFNRKLRDNLFIPEDRILNNNAIHKKMETTKQQNFILVDDFVGSGHQTCSAWSSEVEGKTLSQRAMENGHCVIYAPLIVNYLGKEMIEQDCKNLGLTYIYTLGPERNIFSKQCPCWLGDEDLWKKATDLICRKSMVLGIPFSGGMKVTDVRGYQEQGLAIAFEHGMPDACPPIFYWETDFWKPLVHKVYSRPKF